jgi:hypothetical protein
MSGVTAVIASAATRLDEQGFDATGLDRAQRAVLYIVVAAATDRGPDELGPAESWVPPDDLWEGVDFVRRVRAPSVNDDMLTAAFIRLCPGLWPIC